MKKSFLILAVSFLFSAGALASDSGVVRDGSGNLVESWSRKGDRIEVRDRDNNLSRQMRRQGERIEIRDGSGNLVGEMRRDRD
jgi:Ni/Co efflux regulator RcnB